MCCIHSLMERSQGMRYRATLLCFVLLLSLGSAFSQRSNEGVTFGGMPLVRASADVSNQYFVVFKSPPGVAERSMVTALGATVLYSYTIIPAFAVRVPSTSVLDALKRDLRVSYTEPVQV